LLGSMVVVSKSSFTQRARIEENLFKVKYTGQTLPSDLVLLLNTSWKITEEVSNGSFSDNLEGWHTNGEAKVVAPSGTETAVRGGSMIKLGNEDTRNLLSENFLTQTIPESQAPFLGFWYQVYTAENLPGFDDPCFVVTINQVNAFQADCQQLPSATDIEGERYTFSDWQWQTIDLKSAHQPNLTITFYAGNTGDTQANSFVFIDGVTTNLALQSAQNTLKLITSETSTNIGYQYQTAEGSTPKIATTPLELPLVDLPIMNQGVTFSYWLAAKPNIRMNTQLIIDATPPSTITDLQLTHNYDQSLTLSWTAPEGANEYKLQASSSLESLVAQNQEQLQVLSGDTYEDLPGIGLPIPHRAGHLESIDLTPNALGTLNSSWYLAVLSRDAAGNNSLISNVVEVQ